MSLFRGITSKAAAASSSVTLAIALLLGCGEPNTGPPPADTRPANVTPAPGSNNQSAVVGTAVATPPSVTVTNQAGTGLADISVTFVVTGGNGSVTGSPATTDATGSATMGRWTLGDAGVNTLEASVQGLTGTAIFAATATPDVAAALAIVVGDGQTSARGSPVGTPPAVTVLDQYDNPVPGVAVTFVPSGDGQVSGSPATSDANGVATVGSWTLARTLGANTLDASVGGLTGVTFNATGIETPLNLRIDDAYLVQATQRYGTSTADVPMIAGRDAVLRVFVTASISNSETPEVRVRLYQAGSLVETQVIADWGTSVPLAPDEGTLRPGWALAIDGSFVRPGLSMLVDVDPTDAIAEYDETDNWFPAAGTPIPVDVRSLPPMAVHFIPVHHDITGLTGDVNAGNLSSWTAQLAKEYPTAGVDADLGSVYTTSAPELTEDVATWVTVLNEILVLRISEGSSRYYYGVVVVTGGGYGGIAYIPSSPTSPHKVAIGQTGGGGALGGGWIAAHEIGHNHGRDHVPGCNIPTPVDPEYPYPGGSIGVYGLDEDLLMVKPPSTYFDFMSYCGNTWVSDYGFEKILQWRESESQVVTPIRGTETSVLLVWGRMGPREMVLEPAFLMQGHPVLPEQSGSYRVTGLADDGSVLFSESFAGVEVADLPGGAHRHFAFMLPVAGLNIDRLHTILLDGPGGQVVQQARIPPTAVREAPAFTVGRVGGNTMRIDWDPSRHPMAMVRHQSTGRILGLVRGGAARLQVPGGDLEVVFSNGVTSSTQAVQVR